MPEPHAHLPSNPSLERETGLFRKRWTDEMREAQAEVKFGKPHAGPWEPFTAYEELEKRGYLGVVMPSAASYSQGEAFNFLMKSISAEVHLYKLYKNTVIATNQDMKKGIATLSSFLTRSTGFRTPYVASIMEQCRVVTEKAKSDLETRSKSYWETVLSGIPQNHVNWKVEFVESAHEQQLEFVQYRAELERIFEKYEYDRKMTHELDLDSRFRVRVACLLRDCLPPEDGPHGVLQRGVTFETICRLVVLSYIAGGIGTEGGDMNLKVDQGKTSITVGSVRQVLQRASVR
jgi:hypothetical protein